jgi:hypothetical protein
MYRASSPTLIASVAPQAHCDDEHQSSAELMGTQSESIVHDWS